MVADVTGPQPDLMKEGTKGSADTSSTAANGPGSGGLCSGVTAIHVSKHGVFLRWK